MSTPAINKRVIERWIAELKPQRILNISAQNGDATGQVSQTLTNELQQTLHQAKYEFGYPKSVEPGVFAVPFQERRPFSPNHTFDFALIGAPAETPADEFQRKVREVQVCARFLTVDIPIAGPHAWPAESWKSFAPLALQQHGRRMLLLLAGGSRLPAGSAKSPAIWYLAPNHQVFGGVKILYNHVAILRSLGINAILGTASGQNFPAHWFAWRPGELCFADNAESRITERDIVVIPEFQYREVQKYRHVARRLLFVQNPGLAKGVQDWQSLGYDGVLTLGRPDGLPSFLESYLERVGCKLPMFAVPNHFDDDPWDEIDRAKIPGRILCLPRKGPAFVAKLKAVFGSQVRAVNNLSQREMMLEYAAADVYVHTGYPEGLGMPIVEAMLAGCVVCGFSGGGGLDIMQHDQSAFIAKDGDESELIAVTRRSPASPARRTSSPRASPSTRAPPRAWPATRPSRCPRGSRCWCSS